MELAETLLREIEMLALTLSDQCDAECNDQRAEQWVLTGVSEADRESLSLLAARLFPAPGHRPLDTLLYRVAQDWRLVNRSIKPLSN
jgi:hypothetical protein